MNPPARVILAWSRPTRFFAADLRSATLKNDSVGRRNENLGQQKSPAEAELFVYEIRTYLLEF